MKPPTLKVWCCYCCLLLHVPSSQVVAWSPLQWLRRQRRAVTITFPKESSSSLEQVDRYFMQQALEQAILAEQRNEVPIGAIVVVPEQKTTTTTNTLSYRIVSRSHNQVEQRRDASAHAELLALRNAARSIHNWRMPPNTTLYCTLEPCPMCLSSAQLFRVDRIVYGASDHRLGAIVSYVQLLNSTITKQHPYHAIQNVTSGIMAEECAGMVRNFFQKRRTAPQRSRKRPRK